MSTQVIKWFWLEVGQYIENIVDISPRYISTNGSPKRKLRSNIDVSDYFVADDKICE